MSEIRAIFFDAESADRAVARLRVDGFTAEVVRERLQGEDDEEDQPWAVLSDAPAIMLEVLVDQLDGWLDEGPLPPAPAPLDLPSAPKRSQRDVTRPPGS